MSTSMWRCRVIAWIGMATSMSCGDTAPGEVLAARVATETAHEPSTSKALMTPELRAAYIAAVQHDAGDTYRAEREVSGAARFVHPMQRFDATIDGTAMRMVPEQAGTWEMSLSTTGIGCERDLRLDLSAGAVGLEDNRVEIVRPELREWYINGPLGIEQGFTLEHAPSCEGTKVVTIDVSGSTVPELEDADGDGKGDAITFTEADGMRLARYTDLYVTDATGKRLDAWMSVTAGRIALHVDDAGATYPVRIDPLIGVQFCDGVNADCPAHALVAAGTQCRASTGECDKAEVCDGVLAHCPGDARIPDGTVCDDGAGTCDNRVCVGFDEGFGEGDFNPPPDGNACFCQAVGTSPGGRSSAAFFFLGLTFLVTRRRLGAHRVLHVLDR